MQFSDSSKNLHDKTIYTNKISSLIRQLNVDHVLLTGLIIIIGLGLIILYSAVSEDKNLWLRQVIRVCIGFIALFVMAQISPDTLKRLSPWGYMFGLTLLILVLYSGETGQGATRWLNIGIRFQPSELMKLSVPMTIAWYFNDRYLPPKISDLFICLLLIMIPAILIAAQPDLGTAILVTTSGFIVLILSGLSIRILSFMAIGAIPGSLIFWQFMRDYQKQRVITLFDPSSDPLGAGYNIIQSKIAIGSGGLFGKGWANGSQAQLEFLPERSTDFIFAVIGEEFGLMGLLTLLFLYFFVVARGIFIATQAPDTYSRLLAGSISLTFTVYVFVNTAMVTGLIPVVGVPLPLISYGGTSIVTLMAGFGILMSIHNRRKLLSK